MDWVKLSTPQNLDDCVAKKTILKMCNWLDSWEKKSKVDSIKNALLLYGPSGTGKSLYTKLLLKKYGYNEILYFSTNDIRTYSRITKSVDKFINNFTFLSFTGTPVKRIIVFDELEGLGNSDKGCIKKIIELLYPKTSKSKQKMSEIIKYKTPIICITNNINDSKSNKIKKYCQQVQFTLPNKLHIKNILNYITDNTGQNIIEVDLCIEVCKKYKLDYNMLFRFLKSVYTYKINKKIDTINREDIKDFKFLESSNDVIHARFLNSDMYRLSRRVMSEEISYESCYDYHNAFPSILQFIVYDNINLNYSKKSKYLDDVLLNCNYALTTNILDKSIHDNQHWFLNNYTSTLYLKMANEICKTHNMPIENIEFSSILNKNSKTLYTHKIIKGLLKNIDVNSYDLTLTGSIIVEKFLKLSEDDSDLDWFRKTNIVGSIDKFCKFNLFEKEYAKKITPKYKKSILKLL